jgi:beta-glucosidase
MTTKKPASIQSISAFVTEARSLVAEMSLDEKAMLLSGDGWWTTHCIVRLGIPSIMMTDGPHGLRKVAGGGLSTGVPATCFPTASALASSWNTDLLEKVGVALATEAHANDIQIILGPGINMKRSPLGGRNFEYFSEDPFLSGKLAAAYINGVQSQGVGTSLKHFAANNQEFERMVSDSVLDQRTLHEIYFAAFEMAIKDSQPWSVMCSYNKVNGVYASESRFLIKDILKDRWGLKGFAVSDWGAVNNRVAGVNAGLNLEMPGSGEYNRRKIVAAVGSGEIPIAQLDQTVSELLAVILLADQNRRPEVQANLEIHHLLAQSAAAESMVLLKNADQILPLDFSSVSKLAVIGTFAKSQRYQGAGSSQVNPTYVSSPIEELAKRTREKINLVYGGGYGPDGVVSDELIREACAIARDAEAAVIFAGLPDSYESEGFDRTSLGMPEGHNKLIASVSAVQPNVIVVLMNGSAISMPWEPQVKAILEAWLGGQAVGAAIADVLTGHVNPSGKLSETFPLRLEDTSAYPEFPATHQEALYGEGLFIGYRHYDKRKIAPHFPFGFGLSYTTFEYSKMEISPTRMNETGVAVVQATIRNSGQLAGKEIVQLYVHEQKTKLIRPEKELKGFTKIALNPGEEKTIRFELGRRAFAFFDPSINDWSVNPGRFDILIGPSSNTLPLAVTIDIEGEHSVYPSLNRSSLLKEFRDHPKGKEFFSELIGAFGLLETGNSNEKERTPEQEATDKKADMAVMAFLNDMPANKAMAFSEGRFSEERLDEILRLVAQP